MSQGPTEWDRRTNFTAYADVEAAENYRTAQELRAYREERIAKCEQYVDLIRTLRPPPPKLRVLDVGSGSSAFLYALERAGLLDAGVGIEPSASRHAFAEHWRHDEGFRRVRNEHADFAEAGIGAGGFHCVCVVDDTYLYLRAEDDSYPGRLFDLALRALRPDGVFVVDFRNDAPAVATMEPEGRTFSRELPESNAFARAVYRQEPSPDRRWLRNESTYIARDGAKRRKVEITEVCDGEALARSLSLAGFGTVSLYGDPTLAPFDARRSSRVVAVATPAHQAKTGRASARTDAAS